MNEIMKIIYEDDEMDEITWDDDEEEKKNVEEERTM